MIDTPERPTSNEDREGWRAYWAAQGIPWRTEPEIDEERQRFLTERRAIVPDNEKGIYPFRDIKLDRADVEWLLATHESRGMSGPVDWDDPKQRGREGLDLRGVDVRGANLARLPLACLHAGLRLGEFAFSTPAQPELDWVPTYRMTDGLRASVAHLERTQLSGAHLENACLHQARMQGVNLQEAHLEAAFLVAANLEGALLADAHLEGALALAASFEGAEIMNAHFEQANLLSAGFGGSVLVGAHVEDADLSGATFSDTSRLNGAWLGSREDGLARLVDVRWSGVNVALVHWVQQRRHGRRRPYRLAGARASSMEGYGALAPDVDRLLRGPGPHDEATVRLLADRRALRASRQVALLLREQGLYDEANRFAYRAQVLQLRVLRRQRHLFRYVGSQLLNLVSGYGYRPLRSVATYLLVVTLFALAYWALGTQTGHLLTWNEAGVVSLTAFHGRGFFQTAFQPGDPQAALAAIEAVIGLLIEIVFIATFTQRFFAR